MVFLTPLRKEVGKAVVDLLSSNIDVITEPFIAKLHPGIREELSKIRKKVKKRG